MEQVKNERVEAAAQSMTKRMVELYPSLKEYFQPEPAAAMEIVDYAHLTDEERTSAFQLAVDRLEKMGRAYLKDTGCLPPSPFQQSERPQYGRC